jgi:hypothetical protein
MYPQCSILQFRLGAATINRLREADFACERIRPFRHQCFCLSFPWFYLLCSGQTNVSHMHVELPTRSPSPPRVSPELVAVLLHRPQSNSIPHLRRWTLSSPFLIPGKSALVTYASLLSITSVAERTPAFQYAESRPHPHLDLFAHGFQLISFAGWIVFRYVQWGTRRWHESSP